MTKAKPRRSRGNGSARRSSRGNGRSAGFPVIDADSHVFEPAAIWEKYLDKPYRTLARSAFWYEPGESGTPTILLNGKPAKPMNLSKINRQAIWRPGMKPEDVGALDPEVSHPVNPGASDPRARLRDMDELGIDVAILFPTLFAEYFPMIESPDVATALARAYNDWIRDFSRKAPKRLVPVAILPVQDVNFALGELRRVAKRGFRAVFLRPCFVGEKYGSSGLHDVGAQARFLNQSYYDPLWTEIQALDLVACIHPSSGSTNPEWSCEGAYVERVAASLRAGHYLAEAIAPQMDNAIFLTAICFYAHMERFPKLRIAMHHSGASWVTLALEKAETYLWLLSNFKDVSLEPEHVFFERPSLVTFDTWESTVARLPDTYGEIAAWGSRYPHHDASSPDEALENLRKWNVPDPVIADYLGGNAARHFGLH
ncbi:MAG: amidohydrolase family protein [Candidatus Binatia bacterium]